MTKIDRIHIDVTYGTTVYQLISTLQEVADYDENATVWLDSADEIIFDVNKHLEEKQELKQDDWY